MLSFGRWGGFYVHRGYSWRLCLGWVAITAFPADFDRRVWGWLRRDETDARRQVARA